MAISENNPASHLSQQNSGKAFLTRTVAGDFSPAEIMTGLSSGKNEGEDRDSILAMAMRQIPAMAPFSFEINIKKNK